MLFSAAKDTIGHTLHWHLILATVKKVTEKGWSTVQRKLRAEKHGSVSALPEKKPPKTVLSRGEAAEDALLHLGTLYRHAPLLARPRYFRLDSLRCHLPCNYLTLFYTPILFHQFISVSLILQHTRSFPY
ncbi:hypothetical protein VNO78_04988 [Psophocarpus tetragonolobus]|uniref:Uncharacterized protein n=1 Tax=Psophocarpus tetragonolobus TaxID=3891 RepID=A0AAN9SQF3_PSOTE